MKISKLIIIFVFLKCGIVCSQECEVYSYDINSQSNEPYLKNQDVSYSCDLRLYDSAGKYDIVFVNEFSNDQIEDVTFSYGYFVRERDRIILIDQTLNYKMILAKKKNYVVFLNGF